RGRYQGMYTLSWSAAALIAPLMSGVVIDHFGAGWLWATTALLGTVAAAGYWLLMRGLPTGETAVAETAAPSPRTGARVTKAEASPS
ncbi:MFS transporter, partial [Streptomyces sp. DT225]